VWAEEELDGLRLLRGRLDGLEVALLPEVGGKMISLRSPTGREWLWQTPRRPFRKPDYGGAFEAYDISGFDECFPGIGEGPYPLAPWEGVTVPDHGELWTLPWDHSIAGNTLTLAIHGVRFPYRIEKRVTLQPGRPSSALRLHYRLENLSPFPLRYLWSAHPLFAATPGMRVLLPQGVRVRVDWSKHGRLGELGAEHPWPRTRTHEGREVALDLLPPEDAATADKLYTTRLPSTPNAGWCALHDPATGDQLTLRFDPTRIPYIGVWLNLNGWPFAPGTTPCYNVALEPCTGFPDRLDEAVRRDEAATLPARGVVEWWLRLEPDRGG
jgi:galactose mutarotase-like enzyme